MLMEETAIVIPAVLISAVILLFNPHYTYPLLFAMIIEEGLYGAIK